jgi:hypothetical protein
MNTWGNNTLQSQYGLDIEKELQDILVQELSSSINAEIIKNLFNKQNIRKAKIEGIKDKIISSE